MLRAASRLTARVGAVRNSTTTIPIRPAPQPFTPFNKPAREPASLKVSQNLREAQNFMLQNSTARMAANKRPMRLQNTPRR